MNIFEKLIDPSIMMLVNRRQSMEKKEFYVYHIVTRKKMRLGQIINFDNNEKNTLYSFFFEKEQLNSKGEDFI
jgi:hypothetical protein